MTLRLKPIEELERHEVHVTRSSDRVLKRVCARAWDWRYRQGWVPNVTPQSLEFGTALHLGWQAIYEPATWFTTSIEQKLKAAVDAFEASCNEQAERYLLATSQTRLTWSGRDDYEARIELGQRMLDYYMYRVHPKEDKDVRPVKTETAFRVYLHDEDGEPVRCYNSPTCGQVHDDGALVVHTGRVDVIFEDLVLGGYLIADWKSVGGDKAVDGTEKNTSRFYPTDLIWNHDQLSFYGYALRRVLKLDVRGHMLCEIRKDYPRLPAPLKRPEGRFSRDKQLATTYETYHSYVTEADPDGYADGYYDGYLEWLCGPEAPVFHKRTIVKKSPDELKEVGISVAHEVQAMLLPGLKPYPEPGPLACKRCAYRGPCDMKMRGMDHTYTLRTQYTQIEVVEW